MIKWSKHSTINIDTYANISAEQLMDVLLNKVKPTPITEALEQDIQANGLSSYINSWPCPGDILKSADEEQKAITSLFRDITAQILYSPIQEVMDQYIVDQGFGEWRAINTQQQALIQEIEPKWKNRINKSLLTFLIQNSDYNGTNEYPTFNRCLPLKQLDPQKICRTIQELYWLVSPAISSAILEGITDHAADPNKIIKPEPNSIDANIPTEAKQSGGWTTILFGAVFIFIICMFLGLMIKISHNKANRTKLQKIKASQAPKAKVNGALNVQTI